VNDKNSTRGHFITFEGGEGVGKSTQIKLFYDHMLNAGYDVVLTREPGGPKGAEQIRHLVLTGDVDKWEPITEALLYYAARTEHIIKTIKPALAAGKWVICDRYADSSFVYQGVGRGVSLDRMKELHHMATGDFWPDLTFILDGDVSLGLERALNREEEIINSEDREDRFERMGEEFHNKLPDAFRKIAQENPDRCRIIAADNSIDKVAEEIWQHFSDRFSVI